MRLPLKNRLLIYLYILLAVIFMVFPFYWIANASFHPESELFNTKNIQWFPDFTYLNNYIDIIQKKNFLQYLINSFFIATGTTIIAISVSSLAAYALARIRFGASKYILGIVLGMSMFPPIAIISPLYLMVQKVDLLNTFIALLFPYIAFTLPFSLWNLTTFFKGLPKELEESADVDGATPFQTFYKIFLPLVSPGIFTTAILVFIFAWNEFLFAVTFISNDSLKTMPVAIVGLPSEYNVPWGQISAAATISTIPLVILVLIFQKRIISGLTSGAVKG
jgi:multiple sugar transport system permease protein